MPRLADAVVEELLIEMKRIVTDYHPDIVQTGQHLKGLIAGTSVFPGGAGLWRGNKNGGALPIYFPDHPVMFVAHNFDSITAYNLALLAGGEVEGSTFWKNLQVFLNNAGPLGPEDCFFTNALMGLKPGSASGSMPCSGAYKEQCLYFLFRQVHIIQPRAVVTLGRDAATLWSRAKRLFPIPSSIPATAVMHPSARRVNQKPDHETWLLNQGTLIRKLISELN